MIIQQNMHALNILFKDGEYVYTIHSHNNQVNIFQTVKQFLEFWMKKLEGIKEKQMIKHKGWK